MKNISIFLFLSIFFFSCDKDDIVEETSTPETQDSIPDTQDSVIVASTFDTVVPLSYFPVYPGSYWDYEIQELNYEYDPFPEFYLESIDTSYATSSTNMAYVEHSYHYDFDYVGVGQWNEIYTDTVLVPIYDGIPIYGYSHVEEVGIVASPSYFKLYPFLKETVGDTFVANWTDPSFTNVGPFYTVLSKTANSQNDSILTLKKFYIEAWHIDDVEFLNYQKDVGLISHYIYSPHYGDTIYRKELTTYFVNE